MANAGHSKQDAIALDDSDEEADGSPSTLAAAARMETSLEQPNSDGRATKSALFLGDRAAMERERLERQRKRRRDAGLPDLEEDSSLKTPSTEKTGMIQSVPSVRAEKAARLSSTASVSRSNGSSSSHVYAKQPDLYWEGMVLKSFNRYSPESPGTPFEDFIRPTTPFRANGLKHAIMATYCEDIQWLSAMFPKGADAPRITMITLAQPGSRPGVYSPLHPQLLNWVRLVVPRPGYSEYTTMHMKFIMLFYEDRMRLMILSGNLLDYDWSRIENTAFIHDFPRRHGTGASKGADPPFETQMRRVLESLTVPRGHEALREIGLYDLSSNSEAHIVTSLPTAGAVKGWREIEKVGVGRLASVAKSILGKQTSVTIECQGSSMGKYSPRWLQQFHIACQGGAYTRHLPLPMGTKAQKAWADATHCREKDKWPPVKLLFPSERWVKTQAVEGVAGAGTFFGKAQQAIDSGFIDLMHQPESVRANVMMHHKAILALQPDADDTGIAPDTVVGWAYMGSHNLTQAAWGNISAVKGSNEVQMSSGNWELGIIVPVRRSDLLQSQSVATRIPSVAANIITWKRPVERYAPGDVPFQMENCI